MAPYGRWETLKSSGWGVDADKATIFNQRINSLDTEAREWLFPDGLSCTPSTAGSGGGGGVSGGGGDGLSPASAVVDPLFLQPLHVTPDALSAGLYREKTVLSCRTGQVLNSMAMLIVPSHTTAAGWLLGWVFSEWAENDTDSLEWDSPPCTSPVTRVALDGGKGKLALSAFFEDGAHVQFDFVEAIPRGGGVNKEQYVVRRGRRDETGGNRARIVHATLSHMEQRAEVAEEEDAAQQGPFRPEPGDGGMLGPLTTGHYFGGVVNALAGLRLTDDSGAAAPPPAEPPPLRPASQLWGLVGWGSSPTDSLLSASSMVSDAPDPALPTATQFELHVDTPGYLTRLRLRAAALRTAKLRVPACRPLGGWGGGQQAPHRRLAVCAPPAAASPPYTSDLPAPVPDEWLPLVPDTLPAARPPAPPEPFPMHGVMEGMLAALPMDWAAAVPLDGDDVDVDDDLAAAAAAATAEWAVPAAAGCCLPTAATGGAAHLVPAQWAVPAAASRGLPIPATGGATAPAAPAGARANAIAPTGGRAIPIAPAGSARATALYPAAATTAAAPPALAAAAAAAAGAPTAGGAPAGAAAAAGVSRRRGPLSPDAVANPVRYARMLRNRESARRSNERRRVARLAARAAKEAERQGAVADGAAASSAGGGSGSGGDATPDGGVH